MNASERLASTSKSPGRPLDDVETTTRELIQALGRTQQTISKKLMRLAIPFRRASAAKTATKFYLLRDLSERDRNAVISLRQRELKKTPRDATGLYRKLLLSIQAFVVRQIYKGSR